MRARRFALVVALVLAAAGCQAGGSPPSPGPSPAPPMTAQPSCSERVFDSMTPAQRVGQLFIFGLRDNRLGPAEIAGIRDHHLGSVAFIETTTVGASGIRAVTDAVQSLATEEATAGVRFYVAANQEGGQIQALRGPGFSAMPSAVEQGTMAPSELRTDAEAWGRELLAAGVNLNFAPVMDVVPAGTESRNEPIGVLERQFGGDPAAVAAHGVAFLEGMARAGVTASAKHFPGLGRVAGNTDFTADVVDDDTTLRDEFLLPFARAIGAGVPMVMVAEATYTRIDPERLGVFSPDVMRLLRETLRFEGVVVSDDIGAAVAVEHIAPGTRALEFLEAGGDLIISKFVQPAVRMAVAVGGAIEDDPALLARVNDASMRVLRAKEASGLLPCPG